MVAGEGSIPLIHEDIMDEAIHTCPAEQLVSPLVRLCLDVLPQSSCSGALVGHHDFVNALCGGCIHLQELLGQGNKDGTNFEEAVSGAMEVLIVVEV